MAKFFTIAFALFVWGILLYFSIPHAARNIQEDIAARAADLVVAQSSISVDGRDVTLMGYEGSPEVSGQTVKQVSALWGVRSVHTRILPLEAH